jgi:hypothetical protein
VIVSSLLSLEFLVLISVSFLWSLVTWFLVCHLLSHHLLEGTVVPSTFSELKHSLLFLWFVCRSSIFFLELFNVRLGQYTCFVRLPLGRVKLLERLKFSENLGSIASEDHEPVVNLETLVES